MSDIVSRTLRFALQHNKPIIVCYQGKDKISQRVVYIRSIRDGRITAYCMQKRAIRTFDEGRILSAQMVEE